MVTASLTPKGQSQLSYFDFMPCCCSGLNQAYAGQNFFWPMTLGAPLLPACWDPILVLAANARTGRVTVPLFFKTCHGWGGWTFAERTGGRGESRDSPAPTQISHQLGHTRPRTEQDALPSSPWMERSQDHTPLPEVTMSTCPTAGYTAGTTRSQSAGQVTDVVARMALH